MTNPHEASNSAQYHFQIDGKTVEANPTESLDITIKVYLYGEESPTNTYQFKA